MATKREKPRHFIDLDGQQWKTSAADWNKAQAGGWIEPVEPGSRVARLCSGVVARIKDGILWLRDRGREFWIRTSWYGVDAVAPVRGENWQVEIEREYGDLRFERWGEIRRAILGWNGLKPEPVK